MSKRPTAPSVNRPLPCNLEAEQRLLCCVISSPTELPAVQLVIQPQDFYQADYGKLFRSAVDFYQAGTKVADPELFLMRVQEQGIFTDNAMKDFGAILTACTVTQHAEHYAKIIADHANRRRTIAACVDAISDAYEPASSVEQAIGTLTAKLEAGNRLPAKAPVSRTEVVHQIIDEIDETTRNPDIRPKGISRGFDCIDRWFDLWYPGELVTVGARVSVGKTQFMLQVAGHVGCTLRRPVLWVNLEMSDAELAERELARASGVNSMRIRSRVINASEDRRAIAEAASVISTDYFHSWSPPAATIEQIQAVARLHQAKHGLDLLVVDYLQLIAGGNKETREQDLNLAATRLKALAKSLGTVVMTGAQLNQGSPQDKKPVPPRLNHLKECRAIADHSDHVMLIYRPQFEENRQFVGKDEAEIRIEKVRNGGTGKEVLMFEKGAGFYDPQAAPKHDDAVAGAREAAFDDFNRES